MRKLRDEMRNLRDEEVGEMCDLPSGLMAQKAPGLRVGPPSV